MITPTAIAHDEQRFVGHIRDAIQRHVEEIAEQEIQKARDRIGERVREKMVEICATISRKIVFEPFGPSIVIRLELDRRTGEVSSPTDSTR